MAILAKTDRCANILRLRHIATNELVLGCWILGIVIIEAFVSRINRDLISLRGVRKTLLPIRRVVTGRTLQFSPFLLVPHLSGHILRLDIR